MATTVPYFDLAPQTRALRAELEAALGRALDRNSFCLGPDVADFERAFADFCGVRHCVAMNSGTSALHVAMLLLNLKPGDEVITTPYTFAATSWGISYCGARPVYADIEPETFNLDPRLVDRAITPRTKAILPVHLYGHPCDLEALGEIARRHGLALVEDAAQAHGAAWHGRRVGGFGVTACFSFYPTKNLGACGEAGALVTDDDALATRARALREHGSTRRYHHDEVGYNYRMEGFQGAVLGVKLKHLEAWTAARRTAAARYTELLAGTPLTLPREREGAASAWHLYTVRAPRRDGLKDFLAAHGIGSAVHYPLPLHLQPCYADLGHRPGDFPEAERACRDVLCLPFFPEITEEQQQAVAAAVREFYG
jgi:dTDP-4-amino-4,6-dideoxygalactose transaminase